MIIQIDKINKDTYRADILDLPGSPYIGESSSPEEAVALVFLNNIQKLRKHADAKLPFRNGCMGSNPIPSAK